MISKKAIKAFCLSAGLISTVYSLTPAIVYAETPPVQPKIQEVSLPPAVEISAPPEMPKDIPNKPLTVEEAVAIALRNQPDLVLARAGIAAAQGRMMQVRSGLLPNLSVGSSYTNQAISPSTGGGSATSVSPSGYQLSANISQLIFDFNHTRNLVRQFSSQQSAAQANLSAVEADLTLAVKLAFYNLAENLRLVTVNEANLKTRQNHLAAARARLNEGVGLPADVVRAETAIASAVYALNEAQTSATGVRIGLAQLMGIDPRTPYTITESSEPAMKEDNLNALVDVAFKQRPEMLEVQSNLDAAGHGLRAANTSNWPSIGANSGWLQRGTTFPPDGNQLTYGFVLKWNPFDSGLTKGRIEEAQAAVTVQQALMNSLKLSITSQVSQAYLRVKSAQQRITTAAAEVANAEEALRLLEGRYQNGLGTFLDVLDAQTTLLTAQTNRVNAESALNQARVVLAQAVGFRQGSGGREQGTGK